MKQIQAKLGRVQLQLIQQEKILCTPAQVEEANSTHLSSEAMAHALTGSSDAKQITNELFETVKEDLQKFIASNIQDPDLPTVIETVARIEQCLNP